MNWRDHIETNPETLGGKPVIRGTRLSVEFVLSLYAAGWTDAQVLESYPALTVDSLRAVFAYAAESLGAEGFLPRRRRAG